VNWPFVSRGRFEDLERQFSASECERRELLIRLLNQMEKAQESTSVPPATQPNNEAPSAYTTPFDSIGSRFDQAKRQGKVPAQFKARMR
jgi:hypothetical protein